MRVTPTVIPTNCGRWVGRVPTELGVTPWLARDPAKASTRMMGRRRPNTIARPSAVLYHSVLTLIPAKAEPLLLAVDVKA